MNLSISESLSGNVTLTDVVTGNIREVQPSLPIMDLFLIGGQSNAVGQGDHLVSPKLPPGFGYVFYNGVVSDLNDPVGLADSGSAWPSFAKRWFELSGRKCLFVPAAVNGSGQVAGTSSNGTWDETGSLYTQSINLWQSMISALDLSEIKIGIKAVLWSQGERDGTKITEGAITKVQYKEALSTMIHRFYESIGPRFCVFQTGSLTTGDTIGLQSVRSAQQEVCDEIPGALMIFTGAKDFVSESHMSDFVHYDQTGLNIMGQTGAETLFTTLF